MDLTGVVVDSVQLWVKADAFWQLFDPSLADAIAAAQALREARALAAAR